MLCASCGEDLPLPTQRCRTCERPTLLAERYRLEAIIGRSARSTTFRATRLADDRSVAIKEIPLALAVDLKALELAERESRVLAELDHPGVVRLLEAFQAGVGRRTSFYLALELVDGRTLDEESKRARGTEAEVLMTAREILGILRYLHQRSPPVIHRDLKPANVMRRRDGRLVLIDFGSVRDAAGDSRLGGSTVAGTFGFMAPEQFRGVADPATDLYALGVLISVLLTHSPAEWLFDPAEPGRWRRLVPALPATRALLERLLAPELAERAADVAEVAPLLETAIQAALASRGRAPSSQMSLPLAIRARDLLLRSPRRAVLSTFGIPAALVVSLLTYASLDTDPAISDPPPVLNVGRLHVDVAPDGAEVWVNGKPVYLDNGEIARTPLRTPVLLPVGEPYQIVIQRPGFEPLTYRGRLESALEPEKLRVVLKRRESLPPPPPRPDPRPGSRTIPKPPALDSAASKPG